MPDLQTPSNRFGFLVFLDFEYMDAKSRRKHKDYSCVLDTYSMQEALDMQQRLEYQEGYPADIMIVDEEEGGPQNGL